MQVEICRIHPDAVMPVYKTKGSACFDIAAIEDVTISSGEIVDLPTGLIFRIPKDHVLIVQPRSSSPKHGFHLPHGVGIIDSDYCGPNDQLFIRVRNFTNKPIKLEKHHRVAQGYITKLPKVIFKEITKSKLSKTSRGGFGSTGTH